MAEGTEQQTAENKSEHEEVVAKAIGTALGVSVGNMAAMFEVQMATLLALASIVACLPGTADVDPRRVGVLVRLLSANQKEGARLRSEMVKMASVILDLAKQLRNAPLTPQEGAGAAPGPTPPAS